jgi:hypothetical protein
MAMFRRSRKPAPPLHRKQQEIAQQEEELRQKVENLQRLVTESKARAPNKSPERKAEPKPPNNFAERRFHVSIAMDAPQLFDPDENRRPRALRKERRHGQIVFLILLAALALAVMWLVSHLSLNV